MPMRVAVMTMGVLQQPAGQAVVQGFFDRVPGVYAAADESPGFVARWDPLLEPGHAWGEVQIPKCLVDTNKPTQMPATLSVWETLESVAAYAYRGAHREAVSRRQQWFKELGLPSHVIWWVADGSIPSWAEAAQRFDHLHGYGSTAFAFKFGEPFSAAGERCTLDSAQVRRMGARRGSGC